MAMRRKKLSVWRKISRRFRTGSGAGTKAAGGVGGIFATTIGIVNATGFDFAMWHIGVAAGVSGLAGVLAAWLKGTESLLPDAICNDVHTDGHYVAAFCTESQLREANEWTIPLYGAESVTSDVAVQWMLRNPKAFVGITDERGELCASFGMLGLKDGCVELHMRGDVLDSDLATADVLTFAQTKLSSCLYISGVVVRSPGSAVGNRRATVMIWAMLMYVKKLLGLKRSRQLYTIAVTKEAKRLLVNFGFTLHKPGNQRKDGCDLFVFTLDQTSWKRLLAKVGDLSPMCTIHFSGAKK